MEQNNLYYRLKEKISFGNTLINDLNAVEHIDGVTKVQRKIRQEIRFLQKALNRGGLETDYLQCSNLNFFSAIVKCILHEQNVTHVDYPVISDSRKIHIDVVCNNGNSWIKVVARNKKSLSEAVLGQTSHNLRTILDKADDYIRAAEIHPNFFKAPQVIFEFATGIDDFLKNELEWKGVIVRNHFFSKEEPLTDELNIAYTKELANTINILNLDVTALLAYVSNLSNGHCNVTFEEAILCEQAKWERERPINEVLNKLFADRTLICCETARNAFENIIRLIGGPNEKLRAKELLKRVQVMPDTDILLEKSQLQELNNLKLGGRIKQRSKLIFEFGHHLHAITITANEGFVRAAKQQGVEFAVYIHEARALTEMKEKKKIHVA